MSADRTGFFKTLAKSIHSQRQAQQQARDAAAAELLALRRRLVRLQRCEDLAPNEYDILQQVHTCRSEAQDLDAQCAYHCVLDLVSPAGTLSVPVQC